MTTDLNLVNHVNTALGAETGTNVSIGTGAGKTLTINVSSGVLDSSGNRVFNVTGFNTTNGEKLVINGDAAGDNVVFNFETGANVNFNNQVELTGGLTQADVLYNFVGGSNLTGGPTLQINDNASSGTCTDPTNLTTCSNLVEGIFLNPNGPISITNSDVLGRVFGGDTHDFQFVSGDTLDWPPGQAPEQPVPESSSLALLCAALLGIGVMRPRQR